MSFPWAESAQPNLGLLRATCQGEQGKQGKQGKQENRETRGWKLRSILQQVPVMPGCQGPRPAGPDGELWVTAIPPDTEHIV